MSRSRSRGRDKKVHSDELDINTSRNSPVSHHRSRSRSRTKEKSDTKYKINDSEIKQEFEKGHSSEPEYKYKNESARESTWDESKKENGVSP